MNNEHIILKLESKNNSVNGNPKYEIFYTDKDGAFNHATTSSDMAFCYGITNDIYSLDNPQVIARLDFTKSGRIKNFTVVKKLFSK